MTRSYMRTPSSSVHPLSLHAILFGVLSSNTIYPLEVWESIACIFSMSVTLWCFEISLFKLYLVVEQIQILVLSPYSSPYVSCALCQIVLTVGIQKKNIYQNCLAAADVYCIKCKDNAYLEYCICFALFSGLSTSLWWANSIISVAPGVNDWQLLPFSHLYTSFTFCYWLALFNLVSCQHAFRIWVRPEHAIHYGS